VALEGLCEGLVQLGYHEGRDIAFVVEDVQGKVDSHTLTHLNQLSSESLDMDTARMKSPVLPQH
jgi:hypothetical protein